MLTYEETINDVLRQVKKFNDWDIIYEHIRRKPAPKNECPVTCGTGYTVAVFDEVGRDLGYNKPATMNIARTADNHPGHKELRAKLLEACGLEE